MNKATKVRPLHPLQLEFLGIAIKEEDSEVTAQIS
jgi:hypothetical protein